MSPRLAGQNKRFSPRRGASTELTKTLSAITSTNDTSNPRVLPRYQSRLTKLTSINSVTGESVTSRKKKTSRIRVERQVKRMPAPAAKTSNPKAMMSFDSMDPIVRQFDQRLRQELS